MKPNLLITLYTTKDAAIYSFPTYLVGFIIAPLSPQYNKIFQNLFFVKTNNTL